MDRVNRSTGVLVLLWGITVSLGIASGAEAAFAQAPTVDILVKISDADDGLSLDNYDSFGSAVASLGDMDGDGVPDLAVGAPSNFGGTTPGAVHILYMNANGTVKQYAKISDADDGLSLDNYDSFGSAVASLGDMDGDGVPDLAVGAPSNVNGTATGAVHILDLICNTPETLRS